MPAPFKGNNKVPSLAKDKLFNIDSKDQYDHESHQKTLMKMKDFVQTNPASPRNVAFTNFFNNESADKGSNYKPAARPPTKGL